MRKNLAFVVTGEEAVIKDIIEELHAIQEEEPDKLHIIHYKISDKKRFRIEPYAPY